MRTASVVVVCAIGTTAVGCIVNSEPDILPEEAVDQVGTAISAVAAPDTATEAQTPDALSAPVKKAMTWSLLNSAASGGKAYALVGSDAVTNGYQGDTWTSSTLPVLCINKNDSPYPGAGVIGSPVQTPGGAWRRTWSGGVVALTTPVKGTSLSSLAVANAFCASQLGAGFKMAEFHDGDPTVWAGWDFWGAALNAATGPFKNNRFWVSINDQNANPW